VDCGHSGARSAQRARLHSAVDAQLRGKGLTTNTTRPDVIVATHVTTKERKELVANGFGYGPWGLGGGIGTASVETFVDGTLVVDLYDAQDEKDGVARRRHRDRQRQADEEHREDEQGARQDVREVPPPRRRRATDIEEHMTTTLGRIAIILAMS
jgi:hypothetical protein